MLIYGKNPVKDLFNHDKSKIKKVYIDKKRHQSFYFELEKENIELIPFHEFKFGDEVTRNDNTQGIVAKISEPTTYSVKQLIEMNKGIERPVFLILDRIEDPQNFGAILRNAAAFEVNGVIYPDRGAAKLNSTTMKTSAGNWIHLNLCETNSLSNAIKELKENGFWIVSTSLEANSSLKEIEEFDRPLAILMGNEGKGVRKTLQEEADFNIKIKMSNKVESLNVSSATAIILHAVNKNE